MIKIVEVKSVNDVKRFNEIAKKVLNNPQTQGLLVKFYADWCGHCQSMTVDWDKITRELKSKYECQNTNCTLTIANIRVQSMDDNDKIIKNVKHIPKDIQGVPSILFVSNGKITQEYSGERVFEQMLSWIINNNNFPLKMKTTLTPNSHTISESVSTAKTNTLPSKTKSKSIKSSTLKRLIKQAKPKFKEFHSKTLRDFHRNLRETRKVRSVKNRTQTPLPNNIDINNNDNNNDNNIS